MDAHKDLLGWMISNNNYEINNTAAQAYQKEYIELFTQYTKLKKVFERESIAPNFAETQMISWSLNFDTNEVTVIYNDWFKKNRSKIRYTI